MISVQIVAIPWLQAPVAVVVVEEVLLLLQQLQAQMVLFWQDA
jgi:hypothetical protein